MPILQMGTVEKFMNFPKVIADLRLEHWSVNFRTCLFQFPGVAVIIDHDCLCWRQTPQLIFGEIYFVLGGDEENGKDVMVFIPL